MAKRRRLPKYKYSAYVKVGSDWKFLFSWDTKYQVMADLRRTFGKDYKEHPECYRVEKELRVNNPSPK